MLEKIKRYYNLIVSAAGIVAIAMIMPTISWLVQSCFDANSSNILIYNLAKYCCLFAANIVLIINVYKKNTNIVVPLLLFFLGECVENLGQIIVYSSQNSNISLSVFYNLLLFIVDIIILLLYNYQDKKRYLFVLYIMIFISLGFSIVSMFSGSAVGLGTVLTLLSFVLMLYLDNSNNETEYYI